MRLEKWHGLGNDYLFLRADGRLEDPAGLARVLSDRRRGPGADGLIILRPTAFEDADVRMEIRNADGSDGGVCGNGLRCAAAWLHVDPMPGGAASAPSLASTHRIETPAGVAIANVHPGNDVRWSVEVDLASPTFELGGVPAVFTDRGHEDRLVDESCRTLATASGLLDSVRWSCVSTGNPHLVMRLPSDSGLDLESIDLAEIGPRLERHPAFPARINVHAVSVVGDEVRMRTWERGSGLTMACGTGACAVAAVLVAAGETEPGTPRVIHLPGGSLEITWAGGHSSPIRMKGEAVRVGAVEVDDRWIEEGLRRDRDAAD